MKNAKLVMTKILKMRFNKKSINLTLHSRKQNACFCKSKSQFNGLLKFLMMSEGYNRECADINGRSRLL